MSGLGIWLASAVVLGAAVIVAYAALLFTVLRSDRAGTPQKLFALVPLFLPYIGWKVGLRVLPVLWPVLVVAYLVLRAAR